MHLLSLNTLKVKYACFNFNLELLIYGIIFCCKRKIEKAHELKLSHMIPCMVIKLPVISIMEELSLAVPW